MRLLICLVLAVGLSPAVGSTEIQTDGSRLDEMPFASVSQKESNQVIETKILGGISLSWLRYPYMCSLQKKDGTHWCGGALIHPRVVLTAAHCTVVPNVIERVCCGVTDIRNCDTAHVYSIYSTQAHGSYRNAIYGYDVSVIVLDRDTNLQPVTVDSSGSRIPDGTKLSAIGWGSTRHSMTDPAPPDVLQEIHDVPKASMATCLYKTIPLYQAPVYDPLIMCAGGTGTSVCKGDSGGPLILPDRRDGDADAGDPTRDVLVGIVSYGNTVPCTPNKPAGFARVQTYRESFIQPYIDYALPADLQKHKDDRISAYQQQVQLLTLQQKGDRLFEAIKNDNDELATALVLSGLPIQSALASRGPSEYPIANQFSLLHWTAYFDSPKCAKVFVNHGWSVSIKDSDQKSPLWVAAYKGSLRVTEVLLRSGAPATDLNSAGLSVLDQAIEQGSLTIAKFLIDYGANMARIVSSGSSGTFYFSSLITAAIRGRTEIARFIIDKGTSPDLQNTNGWAALHYAASYGNLQLAQLLVQSGANKWVTSIPGRKRPVDVICIYVACDVATRNALWNLLN